MTGTRRAERTQFDSLAAVDVISDVAIDGTASDELMDTLALLVPSFNVRRLPMADGAVFVRPATLRNLSPDHTLVLVNGKRRHRSALLGGNGAQAADLAQIPAFAIKRVEVLRDGAAAQYGSDAIAGVINLILEDTPGFQAFSQYSEYKEGDGEQLRAGAQWGAALGENGFVSATVEWMEADQTSRSRQRPDAVALAEANPGLNVPDPVQNWGQPDRDALRLALNSALPIGVRFEGYLFGTYADSSGDSDFNWRNPMNNGAFNPSPSAYPNFDLRDLYPAGFSPRFGQDAKDYAVVAGMRGSLNERLTMDVSASRGHNEIDYWMTNSINASLGSESPTSFDIGQLAQTETNFNVEFVYQWELAAMAAPVNVALGAELREETYEVSPGEPASYEVGPGARDGLPSGSNGFPGFSPAQSGEFDQDSRAAYVDVEIPLTEALTVGVAGRYEDYSEFGDTLNGKLSARYQITPAVAARGTVSSGFRAPTPGQLYSEKTSQGLNTATLDLVTSGRFSPDGPIAELISARPDADIDPLTSEESVSYTLGLVYQSDAGMNVTVDLYRIKVEDRFGTSQSFQLDAAERAALVAAGVPGGESISNVSFFQNDFDTETRGVDVVATHGWTVGPGYTQVTAAYNYNETEVVSGGLESNVAGRRVFEEGIPQHGASVTLRYSLGAWDLGGRARYYGPWTDYSGTGGEDIFQKFDAETFVDLWAGYQFRNGLTVRVGAENVFDTYPDEATLQAVRGLIYSRNAPYDTDGAKYYIRLDLAL